MIQFVAGMGIGIYFCMVCWLIMCCIYAEKQYPEILERIWREQDEREAVV